VCKNWLKIPNRLGKNVRKPQGGDFLTHTVYYKAESRCQYLTQIGIYSKCNCVYCAR